MYQKPFAFAVRCRLVKLTTVAQSALIVCFWGFRSAIYAAYVEISVGVFALRCHLTNLTTALQIFYFACRPIAQPISLQCEKESFLRLAILPCQNYKSFTGTWGGFLLSSNWVISSCTSDPDARKRAGKSGKLLASLET